MKISGKNILITGYPGVGKTTLIKKLADELNFSNPAGFYTAEIREGNARKGFELISINDNRRLILSHVDIKSRCRVGKYGVDVGGFDAYLQSADLLNTSSKLIIIDEIGKMECYSEEFKKMILKLLDSDKTLIATIAQKSGGLISAIKRRSDIKIFEIDRNNRDDLLNDIITMIQL